MEQNGKLSVASAPVSPPKETCPTMALATCYSCGKEITGKRIAALSEYFHKDCFKCLDCGKTVDSKFIQVNGPDGRKYPLCENDYYRRKNFVCAACNEVLHGSFISALDRKYHLNHFTCSSCSTIFGSQDSYFEHEGSVYCHYHYLSKFASLCIGCGYPILKQFVEINKPSGDENWHPECYMINKFWNVRLLSKHNPSPFKVVDESKGEKISSQAMKQLYFEQEQMEMKIYDIWCDLSHFEETSAACISGMLLHVSNGNYMDAVKMMGNFIQHVEVLFSALDFIECQLNDHDDRSGLIHTKEPKLLCKKVICFLSLLSNTNYPAAGKQGVTQELLSLVTGLAHYLKTLIRTSLTGAIKMENEHGSTTAIRTFLNKLNDIPDPSEMENPDIPPIDQIAGISYLCTTCRNTLEEPCIRNGHHRWHLNCMKCHNCDKNLCNLLDDAQFDQEMIVIYCSDCGGVNPSSASTVVGNFVMVSQLEQYAYLLRVAQQRLVNLLRVKQESGSETSVTATPTESTSYANIMESSAVDVNVIAPSPRNNRSEVGDDTVTRRKSLERLDRRISTTNHLTKRITIIKRADSNDLDALTFLDGAMQNEDSSTISRALPYQVMKPLPPIQKPSKTYLSQLSTLEILIVKHVAVFIMAPLVRDQFALEDLLEIMDKSKHSLWTRVKMGLKNNKPIKKDGVFCVPLETLLERTGVTVNYGVGSCMVRIPKFVKDCVSVLKEKDMTQEGIFRKNGNIRRLKELSDSFDRNASSVDLSQENAIQVAALLKKFLRDMPDPVLTFKMHKLFVYISRIDNPTLRKKLMQLAFIMLPEENRELAEALFMFFRWFSTFSYIDENTGNKMGLPNLATVITPNILYSKSKDPTRDESFLANETVLCLLENLEEFAMIPEEISSAVNDDFSDGPVDLSNKDILKKAENFVKTRRLNSLVVPK